MYNDTYVRVVIGAGGIGSRMNANVPKQFLLIEGKTILERTVEKFYKNAFVDEIVVVTNKAYLDFTENLFAGLTHKPIYVIAGGESRQDSIYEGLKFLEGKSIASDDIIVIHDAARPYLSETLMEDSIEAAYNYGAATAAIIPKDTIRNKSGGTLVRSELYCVQTPQSFRAEVIREAYNSAFADGFHGTDDAGLVERIGFKVAVVKGEEQNIKITTKEDLKLSMRVGSGYDVHKFKKGRKLILGGVEIDFKYGLDGHSDADVLLHAITDALLGAAAMGDIGHLFPDTDDSYKGISSLILLEKAWEEISNKGYNLVNIDATVICEAPKLVPYLDEIKKNIAESLGVSESVISVKATTTEKLGFTGRGEGIAAQAVCMLSCVS